MFCFASLLLLRAGLCPLVHTGMPKSEHLLWQTAEAMGVVSLRRSMLAQTADSMQLGMESMEAFGQSEALTTRLKHIIDAYTDGPGILLELVQNAGVLVSSFMGRKACLRFPLCCLQCKARRHV